MLRKREFYLAKQLKQINIIAEIANSHQGDPKLALDIARQVVNAGANSIKFQIYFADEFLTTTHPRYTHFKNQSFSKDEWKVLLNEAKKLGVEVYVDIFGFISIPVMASTGFLTIFLALLYYDLSRKEIVE